MRYYRSRMKKGFFSEYRPVLLLLPIIVVVVITAWFAYHSLSSIVTQIKTEINHPKQRLDVNELLSDLVDAENHVKSFGLTNDTLYLRAFYKEIRQIDVDLTEIIETNKHRKDVEGSFDTLQSAVTTKIELLNELLVLRDPDRSEKAITQIEQEFESVTSKINSNPKGKEEEKEQEKKGLFRNIFNRQKDKDKGAVTENETGTEENPLQKIQIEVKQIKRKTQQEETSLKNVELELIEQDRLVTNKIRTIVDNLQKWEAEKLDRNKQEATDHIDQTNSQIAWILALVGVLLVLMAAIIINYIRNSLQYRRALKHAKTEAESLARTKEKFLANMSHEIRTPMNAISGFAEQLDQSELSKTQKEQVGLIRKSSDHMLYLINDILDLNKLQAGKLKLETTGFKPAQIVEEVIGFVEGRGREKGLEMKVDLDKNIPEVLLGDPFRLRQILINLLSNAIKFTENGYIELKGVVALISDKQIEVSFEVTDTGVGISQENISRIFEEFEQAEVSTARNYGGTGLGLSITKMLLDLHGGSIQIQSLRSKGTTIKCKIPYGIGTETDLEEKVNAPAQIDLTDVRILIADDEAFNRKLLISILSKYGASYAEALNGKEAIDMVKQGNFDLVLMDVRMPVLGGVDATARIRKLKQENKRSIPIVATTAAVMKEDQKKYKDAGFNSFLPKPFKEEELLQILKNVLNQEFSTDSMKEKAQEVTTSSSEEVLDFKSLRELSQDDQSFYKEMLEIFIDTTSSGIVSMETAYLDEKWEEMADYAHKICSPCKHLGAEGLYRELKEIEGIGRQHENSDRLSELISSAKAKCQSAIEQANSELEKISS